MKLSINDLKSDRQWRSAIGYDRARFEKLLVIFENSYEILNQGSIEDIKAKSPKESVIKNCEDKLLLTLFSLKSGLTYDVLGLVTGMDGSTAKRNQELGVRVLKHALQESGHAPKREFKTLPEFRKHFADCDSIIIDGTEQRIERPKAKDSQKQSYSGKKKLIPLKQRSSRIRPKK